MNTETREFIERIQRSNPLWMLFFLKACKKGDGKIVKALIKEAFKTLKYVLGPESNRVNAFDIMSLANTGTMKEIQRNDIGYLVFECYRLSSIRDVQRELAKCAKL